jgi:hypothetical protein
MITITTRHEYTFTVTPEALQEDLFLCSEYAHTSLPLEALLTSIKATTYLLLTSKTATLTYGERTETITFFTCPHDQHKDVSTRLGQLTNLRIWLQNQGNTP